MKKSSEEPLEELIFIEDLSKRPLEEAIALEFQLLQLEFPDEHLVGSKALGFYPRLPRSDLQQLLESLRSGGERRRLLEALVRQLKRLNGCANGRSKGRELTIDVLDVAAQRETQVLASGVLQSFLELRQRLRPCFLLAFGLRYLYKASQRMLWIDPQLSNNLELEKCLAPRSFASFSELVRASYSLLRRFRRFSGGLGRQLGVGQRLSHAAGDVQCPAGRGHGSCFSPGRLRKAH